MNNNITVEDWLKKWVNTYKRGNISNITLSSYILAINNYIIPEMGKFELQKVQAINIQQLLTKMNLGQLETTNKCLSAKTIKDTYCILNMAFDTAINNNLLKENCVQKVTPPKLRKKEPQIMTIEEQRKFEQLFEGKYGFVVYLFLLKTGERASEAAGSTWDDIDFNNKIVRVKNGIVRAEIFDENLVKKYNTIEDSDLKSESSARKIPMLFGLYDILLEYRRQYMEVNNIRSQKELKGKPLFLTEKKNRIQSDFLWTKLDRFLKKNDFRHIGIHQLRHTFATRCLEAGISVKYLQKLLGHSTTRMTDRYTHLLSDFENDENKKINDYYNKDMRKNSRKNTLKYNGKIMGKIRITKKLHKKG